MRAFVVLNINDEEDELCGRSTKGEYMPSAEDLEMALNEVLAESDIDHASIHVLAVHALDDMGRIIPLEVLDVPLPF
jgi:hypothetical protein